ncbi:MAG: ketoacyl-ACP synthase III [bacterium]|nr:ketoacyl-ACP synthase III [bacterium]
MKQKVKLVSVGHYLPEKILTNADLEKMVDTSDEWITQRTGIKERRIASSGETAATMGVMAAKDALQKAGLSADDIDIIICATITGDYQTPSTSCLIQKELAAKKAFAFDISAACSGFIYGLDIAEKYIASDPSKRVLIVATEKLSSVTDWKDRVTCVLFGDGAGAAIVEASNDSSGILRSELNSNGDNYDLLIIKAGGSKNPASQLTLEQSQHFLEMQGNEVFKNAVTDMKNAAVKVVECSGWNKDDIKLLIPHQANIRIIEAIRKRLKLKKDQVYINLHKIGNTSASTIPIALSQALEESRIQKGDKIVLVSFGAGFTSAGMTIEW